MRAPTLAAVVTLLCGLAAAVPSSHVLHERRDFTEEVWERRSRAHLDHIVPVRIALKQRNLENAEKYVMAVSDPSSPSFGKHWTAEEVANTFSPSEETNNRVLNWLYEFGIDKSRVSHSKGRNWLEFDATVDEIEHLLHTDYHIYEHTPSTKLHLACDEYHVPHDIQEHIDFIMPTIQLDKMVQLGKRSDSQNVDTSIHSHVAVAEKKFPPMTGLTGLKYCDKLITIECLRALYKFPHIAKADPSNALGIAEWSDYLYRPDLKAYFYNYTKPVIPQHVFPEFLSIDGGKRANLSVAKQQLVCSPPIQAHDITEQIHETVRVLKREQVIESALDFQTAYSIIYPQKIRLYQMGDSVNVNSVGTFNIFLDALDASYCTYKGGDSKKYDTEAALPRFYQHRQCHEWMKLGLQGVSVLFASGDSGVAMRFNAGFPNKCLAPHSNKRLVNGTRFNPGFPANCPYVTAVGATDLLTNSIHGGEKAVAQPNRTNPEESFFSGGGFSNYFTLPSYQAKDVTHFLKTYKPKYGPNVFNQSGNARAYPDVSSLGLNLATVYLNNTYGVGGTSASAPTVASIVTLLNEKRLEAGKSPLGFLNPFFYANPDAFNDITVGGNPGCGTRGFRCQKGWDPITGLGSKFEIDLGIFNNFR